MLEVTVVFELVVEFPGKTPAAVAGGVAAVVRVEMAVVLATGMEVEATTEDVGVTADEEMTNEVGVALAVADAKTEDSVERAVVPEAAAELEMWKA